MPSAGKPSAVKNEELKKPLAIRTNRYELPRQKITERKANSQRLTAFLFVREIVFK
jgi:hypothetical protein